MSIIEKVVVIGLDGATFELIDKWIDKGWLPNIKSIIENGVRGTLETVIPPVTGPAWVSFATGRNPGKHGCFGFVLPREEINNTLPISTKDIKCKTFFEILNKHGKKSILINLPGTYPPLTEDITITSLLTRGSECVFPKNLKDEIPCLKRYRILPDTSLRFQNIESYVKDIRLVEKIRFECAKELFTKKPWDFFFVLFNGVDEIQHELFDKMLTAKSDDLEYVKYFKEVDEYIGWFMRNLPENTVLFIISDHGFKTFKGVFYVNSWLEKMGYAKFDYKLENTLATELVDENKNKLFKYKLRLKIPFVKKAIFRSKYMFRLGKFIFNKLGLKLPIYISPKYKLNTRNSKAYFIATTSGIYINDERFKNFSVRREMYSDVREQIISKILELNVCDVKRKEEVFSGNMLKYAPDIILLPKDYWVKDIMGPIILKEKINNHDTYGVFLAYGFNIKKKMEINKVNIVDLAPTILSMLGCPIPEDVDGRVLNEILDT